MPTQNILIEVTAKTDGVTTVEQAVKSMGDTAEKEFTKTNNNLKQTDAYWKQVASGVDRYTEKVKQAGDAAAGAFVTKGAKELDGQIKTVTQSIETLRAKIGARQEFLIKATDIDKIVQYNKEIEALQAEMAKLQNAGKAGFDGLGNKIAEAERVGVTPFNRAISRATDLSAIAGRAVTGLTRQIVALGVGFLSYAVGAKALEFLGEVLMATAKSFGFFKDKMTDAEISEKALTDVVSASADAFGKAEVEVSAMSEKIRLARAGVLDKTEALKEFNTTIGKTIGHAKDLAEADQLMIDKGPAYIKMTFLKAQAEAAGNLAKEAAAKQVKLSGENLTNLADKYDAAGAVIRTFLSQIYIGATQGEKVGIAATELATMTAGKQKEQLGDAKKEYDSFIKLQKQFIDEAADLAKTNKLDFYGGKEATKHVKDATDALTALRKQLFSIEQEEEAGILTTKKANEDRQKAYDDTLKKLFDLGKSVKNPLVQKLLVELDPINKAVLEQEIHDLVAKMPHIQDKLLAPSDQTAALRALIVKNTTESIQKISDLESQGYLHDLENQKSYLEAGFITQEQYANNIEAIKQEHDRSELSNQVALSEALVDNLKARGFDTTEEERKLNEEKLKLYDLDNKNFEKSEKKKTTTAKDQAKNREALITAGATLLLGANEILLQSETDRIEKEKTLNQDLLDQKLITQAEFNKRQEKLRQEEAALSKRKAIFDIFIEGAKQIFTIKAQAAALMANPLTLPLGVAALAQIPMVLISEAVQLALVAARKYRHGKVAIDGPGTETSDSIPAFLSRNESVINAEATKRYRPALEAINSFKFEEYLAQITAPVFKIPNMPLLPAWAKSSSAPSGQIDYEKMAEAIASKIPGTDVRIDKEGIVVIAKEGIKRTEFVNRKYSFRY